jgi:hypothetical protein
MITVLVVIGVYQTYFAPTTYEAETTATSTVVVTEEVQVDNISRRIEDAQAEARGDIEQKAQAEYDAIYKAEMAKVKAAVLLEVEQELEAQRLEVEKQVQGY